MKLMDKDRYSCVIHSLLKKIGRVSYESNKIGHMLEEGREVLYGHLLLQNFSNNSLNFTIPE